MHIHTKWICYLLPINADNLFISGWFKKICKDAKSQVIYCKTFILAGGRDYWGSCILQRDSHRWKLRAVYSFFFLKSYCLQVKWIDFYDDIFVVIIIQNVSLVLDLKSFTDNAKEISLPVMRKTWSDVSSNTLSFIPFYYFHNDKNKGGEPKDYYPILQSQRYNLKYMSCIGNINNGDLHSQGDPCRQQEFCIGKHANFK